MKDKNISIKVQRDVIVIKKHYTEDRIVTGVIGGIWSETAAKGGTQYRKKREGGPRNSLEKVRMVYIKTTMDRVISSLWTLILSFSVLLTLGNIEYQNSRIEGSISNSA